MEDCWKCGGSGYIGKFNHIQSGICFACNGNGKISTEEAREQSIKYLEKYKKSGKISHLASINQKYMKGNNRKEYLSHMQKVMSTLGEDVPTISPSSLSEAQKKLVDRVPHLTNAKKKVTSTKEINNKLGFDIGNSDMLNDKLKTSLQEGLDILSDYPQLKGFSVSDRPLKVEVVSSSKSKYRASYNHGTNTIQLNDSSVGMELRDVFIHEFGHLVHYRHMDVNTVEDSNATYGYSTKSPHLDKLTDYLDSSVSGIQTLAKNLGIDNFDLNKYVLYGLIDTDSQAVEESIREEILRKVPTFYSLSKDMDDRGDVMEVFAESFLYYMKNPSGFKKAYPELHSVVEGVMDSL